MKTPTLRMTLRWHCLFLCSACLLLGMSCQYGTTENTITAEVDVLVVGAGFAGVYSAYTFSQQHHPGVSSFLVVDENADLGGTWYLNRYPGATSDIPIVDYSYTIPEVQSEYNWTTRYAEQPQILEYINWVAERFNLRQHIRFNEKVLAATWHGPQPLAYQQEQPVVVDGQEHIVTASPSASYWLTRTNKGTTYKSKFLILAVGCLTAAPKQVDIPGLENFAGVVIRTSNYFPPPAKEATQEEDQQEDDIKDQQKDEKETTSTTPLSDFSGHRVGLFGVGSSGVQITSRIAESAEHLTVFQRTAGWVVPAKQGPLQEGQLAAVKSNYEQRRALARMTPFGMDFNQNMRAFAQMSEEERRQELESRWTEGGFAFVGAFLDLVVNPEVDLFVQAFLREKLAQIVHDPHKLADLTPEIPYVCKRPVIDDRFYATFNRDNVALVNLRNNPIKEVTAHSIITADGTAHPLSVIVLALGFDALTGPIKNIDITGRHGLKLADAWNPSPQTYFGLQSHQFPNLFFVSSVQSPSVLSNMVPFVQDHIDIITNLLTFMFNHGYSIVEPLPESQEQWAQLTDLIGKSTLFGREDCPNWYKGSNIPGKSNTFLPFLGLDTYLQQVQKSADEGYSGFQFF